MSNILITFIIVQLISSTLASIKYSTTGHIPVIVDVLVNAISVGISSLVTLYLVQQSQLAAVVVPIVCTLLAVPTARIIIDKLTPDKLRVYEITVKCNRETATDIKQRLKMCNIGCIYTEIIEDRRYKFSVYSETKTESRTIVTLFSGYDAHANVVETKPVIFSK